MCPTSDEVILTNMISRSEGRVQVCQEDGFWKGLCDSRFRPNEATVVCTQLNLKEDGILLSNLCSYIYIYIYIYIYHL